MIRSDIAEMVDRAAAMSVYAFNAIQNAASGSQHAVPNALAERLAESTYSDVLRYSLEECACPCHQEHTS